jgi:hypothetical protein
MSSTVSNKIKKIYNILKGSNYTGDHRCHHFAVAIRGGKVITPVSCNYYRINVFGTARGTIHAEMNSLSYVLNTDKSFGYNNHNLEETWLLPIKGIR